MENTIILDMALVIKDFERMTYGMDLDGDAFLSEIISLVLDHIEEYTYAQGNIGEFVSHMRDLYENHIDAADIDNFEKAVSNLTYAIFNNLAGIGAYDSDQILRYRFKAYVGKDLVFSRVADDEQSDGPY